MAWLFRRCFWLFLLLFNVAAVEDNTILEFNLFFFLFLVLFFFLLIFAVWFIFESMAGVVVLAQGYHNLP